MPISALDPQLALVVVDVQNGVVAAATAPYPAADVVSRIAALATALRGRRLPVVLVRVTARPDGADAPPGRTEVRGRGVAMAEGWDQVVDALTGHPEDVLVTKRGSSAFYGTDLDLHLRRRGVTQIVLTGIATSRGVESTARAAYDSGYSVALPVDVDDRP